MATETQNPPELTSLLINRDALKDSIAARDLLATDKQNETAQSEGFAAVTANEKTRLAEVEARIAELAPVKHPITPLASNSQN